MLETKTVCSFEIFKTGKQNNASVLLFSVLYLGKVNQKYWMAETCTDRSALLAILRWMTSFEEQKKRPNEFHLEYNYHDTLQEYWQ